jgi:aspartate kinase
MSAEKRIVCKFGGSSVADAGQFKKIKDILAENPQRQIVVVSAPGKRNPEETKLTDLFYSTYDLALKKVDFTSPFALIQERFAEIAGDLSIKEGVSKDLEELALQLKNEPESISEDYLVSRGEFLNAKLMAQYLGAEFIDAFDLIEFDSMHRVSAESYAEISKKLNATNGLVVVPGFYGRNHQGILKTFSRGGSDISGAILAHAIDAEIYENWTDVSGLLMADPRIVDKPKPMEYVSYREIRELAYSGANVFHDEAIAPCRRKNIRVNIRNTNRPQDKGTIIGPVPEKPSGVITGVAGRRDFAMVYMEKDMMNKEKGFGRRILEVFEAHNISWEHAPTGIDSMSIVVDQAELDERHDELLEELQRMMEPDEIKVIRDIALLATVGHGMTHRIGVAAQMFGVLAEEKINVRVIDQGSSEINIIAGIDNDDYEKAIQAIYRSFSDENL